ncbi:MAG: CRISPR-associated helicase Cas3' [bacterium]
MIDSKLNKFKLIEKYKKSIAKTDGLSLYEHINHLVDESKFIFDKRKNTFKKYSDYFGLSKELLFDKLIETIVFHDYGKSSYIWQKFARSRNIMNVGFRHELSSLLIFLNKTSNNIYNYDKFIQTFIEKSEYIIPVLSHHNNLSEHKLHKFDNLFINDCNQSRKLSDILKEIGKEYSSKYSDLFMRINKDICGYYTKLEGNIYEIDNYYDFWYKNSLNRHYLQLCDRRSSAKEDNKDPIKLKKWKEYELNPNWKPRELQKVCKNNNDDILLLRAMTGAGKTSASLLWANNQIKNGKADRMIITMPTQFTSNALTNSIKDEDIVDDIYTQHSAKKFDYSRDELNYSRSFESVVNVCTIDQVLYSLTLCKEEHHSRLFNIVNSCVVIDESDFYDEFIQSNIVELLKFLKYFKVPVMIMSATLPDSFVDFLKDKLNLPNLKMVDDTSNCERKRVSINNIIYEEDDEYENKILDTLNKKTAIIYCNTVSRAKYVYNLLKKSSNRNDIILYHSEFTKNNKDKIEKKIINLLGKKKHEEGTDIGIVIMTQIGELSINISSDYILSDICPIDRLIQRFGRGNRFNKEICNIDLVVPTKNGNLYPAPYGEYDMSDKEWVANEYFSATLDVLENLDDRELNGFDYISIINKIYPEFSISNKSKLNSINLIKYFKQNVFLNSKLNISDENEDNSLSWKSRDISPQVRLYIGSLKGEYESNLELDELLFKNSINISYFNFKKISDILIKNDNIIILKSNDVYDDIIYSIDIKYYSDEFGLDYESIFIDKNKTHEII